MSFDTQTFYLTFLCAYTLGAFSGTFFKSIEELYERRELRKKLKEDIKKLNKLLSITDETTLSLLRTHRKNKHEQN